MYCITVHWLNSSENALSLIKEKRKIVHTLLTAFYHFRRFILRKLVFAFTKSLIVSNYSTLAKKIGDRKIHFLINTGGLCVFQFVSIVHEKERHITAWFISLQFIVCLIIRIPHLSECFLLIVYFSSANYCKIESFLLHIAFGEDKIGKRYLTFFIPFVS